MKNKLLCSVLSLVMFSLFGMEPQGLSLTALPKETMSMIILKVNPFHWPHILRTCNAFRVLFADNGLISFYVSTEYEQSVLFHMKDSVRVINQRYQYALLTQDQKTLDKMRHDKMTWAVDATRNWLSMLYKECVTNTDLTALFWACVLGNVPEVEDIIKKLTLAKLNDPLIRRQLKPVFVRHNSGLMCGMIRSSEIREILNRYGFDFNKEIPDMGIPLMQAIGDHQCEMVKYLVRECKVNTNKLLPIKSNRVTRAFFSCVQGQEPTKNPEASDHFSTHVEFYMPLAYVMLYVSEETYKKDLEMVKVLIESGSDLYSTGSFFGGRSAHFIFTTKRLSEGVKKQFQEVFDESIASSHSLDRCITLQ